MISSRWLKLSKFDRNIIIDPVISVLHCANSRISVSAKVLDRMMFDQSRFDIQFCPPLDWLTVDSSHRGRSACAPSTGFRLLLRSKKCFESCIINVLALDLIRTDGRPPESSVQDGSEELGEALRHGRIVGDRFHGKKGDKIE